MKYSLILALFIALQGCGSSSSSDSSGGQSSSDLLKLSDVTMETPSGIQFNNQANSSTSAKMINKLKSVYQKFNKRSDDGIYTCDIGGTLQQTTDDNNVTWKYSSCINYNSQSSKYEYIDGIMEYGNYEGYPFIKFTKYSMVPDYENSPNTGNYYEDILAMYKNKTASDPSNGVYLTGSGAEVTDNQITNSYEYKDMLFMQKNRNSFYIDGSYKFKIGSCDTVESLYKMNDNTWLTTNPNNPDYIDSGTIYVNGVKYVFNGDKVTITKNSKTNTFTQQEFIKANRDKYYGQSCSTKYSKTIDLY